MTEPVAEAMHAVVRGRVQGVGFRYSVVDRADRLGLAGWVRNRRDGSVEVMAQGRPEDLDDLRRFLHRGPAGARVSAVEVDTVAVDGRLGAFDLLPTL